MRRLNIPAVEVRATARRRLGKSASPSFLLCLLCLFAALHACAAVPTLDHLFPAGGQCGTTFTVTAAGKFDPWPVKAWVDCAGVTFTAEKERGTFSVTLSTNAPIGPHLVRIFNPAGASDARTFVIGREAELTEKEPNDGPATAQLLDKLPLVINGRLEKSSDVDCFRVNVQAGQWLVASVQGYALGSPMDPTLELLDESGTRLAFSHDTHNLDPLIAWQAKKSGTCTLVLAAFTYPPAADVRFTGSAACIYRLTVTDGPFAQHAVPAGAQRGRKSALTFAGWNLAAAAPAELDLTAALRAEQMQLLAPGVGIPLTVPISDAPELVAREVSHTLDQSRTVPVPCAVTGCLEQPGAEDRFAFSAKKGERFEFRVQAAALRSLLLALLKVQDATGQTLASADDVAGEKNPQLAWTAPADGSFFVTVSDLAQQGSTENFYRLEIGPPVADFRATVDAQTFSLGTGKTNEIKLTVAFLNGFKTNLLVKVLGLPAGVTMPEVKLEKAGDVKLLLVAAEDVEPASAPIQIQVSVPGANPPLARLATFNLKSGPIPGDLLVNQTKWFWLTLAENPATPNKPAKKKK